MSASQRRKGAAAEREAHGLLLGLLGDCVKRRRGSDQSADGGHDLDVAHMVAVEVKRQERAQLVTWTTQAVASAIDAGKLAAVMWRPSRSGWIVAMPVEDWAALVREALPQPPSDEQPDAGGHEDAQVRRGDDQPI